MRDWCTRWTLPYGVLKLDLGGVGVAEQPLLGWTLPYGVLKLGALASNLASFAIGWTLPYGVLKRYSQCRQRQAWLRQKVHPVGPYPTGY